MNVVEYLKHRDAHFELIPHRKTRSAHRMSEELHIPQKMVAKSVLLRADHGYQFFVAVLPANRLIDLERLSAAFGGAHIELATNTEVAQHCPDCERGVLPPFGSQYGMKTVIDTSLLEADEIVFEGNTHREAIRMSLDEYRRAEAPTVVSFATEIAARRPAVQC